MGILPETYHYLSEGTPGLGPSSHKARLAGRVLGREVYTMGVLGPEPSTISQCVDLVWEKWRRFHKGVRDENGGPKRIGTGVELVADVTVGYGMQGDLFPLDARKETGVRARGGQSKAQVLGKRVARRMKGAFGHNNVVSYMDAGVAVAHCDYGQGAVSVAVGAARSYLTLPGNPLADAGLVADYVQWTGLGDRHFNAIPMGIDTPTFAAFLFYINWFQLQGYSNYTVTDVIRTPYARTYTHTPEYVRDGVDFYAQEGRIPDGMLDILTPALAVELLDFAYNFPAPLLLAVAGAAAKIPLMPDRTRKATVIYAR